MVTWVISCSCFFRSVRLVVRDPKAGPPCCARPSAQISKAVTLKVAHWLDIARGTVLSPARPSQVGNGTAARAWSQAWRESVMGCRPSAPSTGSMLSRLKGKERGRVGEGGWLRRSWFVGLPREMQEQRNVLTMSNEPFAKVQWGARFASPVFSLLLKHLTQGMTAAAVSIEGRVLQYKNGVRSIQRQRRGAFRSSPSKNRNRPPAQIGGVNQ